jgi:hypothetical protein
VAFEKRIFPHRTSCTNATLRQPNETPSVDCTALRTLALATPPTALETPDAGLTPT